MEASGYFKYPRTVSIDFTKLDVRPYTMPWIHMQIKPFTIMYYATLWKLSEKP